MTARVPLEGEAQQELDAACDRAERFLRQQERRYDGVEVWWRYTAQVGMALSLDGAVELPVGGSHRILLRAFRGREVRIAEVTDPAVEVWGRALARARPRPAAAGPRQPTARRPPPMTYDPGLAAALARRDNLGRLGRALVSNLSHEGERLPGLRRLEGQVSYRLERVVATGMGALVTRLSGGLIVEAEINGAFGERSSQLHAPESLLPLALLGARIWRTMPREAVSPGALRPSGGRVVLHPRVVEALLRAALPTQLRSLDGLPAGARVASNQISLIDDPGLDGLGLSRAFDDAGRATRRRALIIRGRLTDRLVDPAQGDEGTLSLSSDGLQPALSSLLMERGATDFHELVEDLPATVMVHAVGPVQVSADGRFEAPVRWGQSLERARFSRLLAPGAWRLRGRLLSGLDGPGCLEDAEVSRELVDTGTGVLPYCLVRLET